MSMHVAMSIRVAQLEACATWNAEKACAAYRQARFAKNNAVIEGLLKDYRRLIQNADGLRRQAFLLSHQRH